MDLTEVDNKLNQQRPEVQIQINDLNLNPQVVINALMGFVSEERKRSIDQVLQHRTRDFVPLLENIYDAGNISASMRSAEAHGFFEFHVINKPDAFFKSSTRITQGTHKWMDINTHTSPRDCLKGLKKRGFKIYCTHLEGAIPIQEVDFSQKTALVFGNEKDGVSEEMQNLCDGRIILPMHGFAQSFNVSVAAALCFYHAFNERQSKLGKSGNLSQNERDYLKALYYFKSVKKPESLINRFLE